MEKHRQKFFKSFVLILWLITATACATKSVIAADSDIEITVPSTPVTEGELFFVSVSSPKKPITSISAIFHEKEIIFFPEDKEAHHHFKAMVGVEDGLSSQKSVEMIFKICTSDSECTDRKIPVLILAGKFPFEKITVLPRYVAPNKKEQKEIARNQKLLRQVYKAKTEFQYWDPPAVMPIDSVVTSFYGTRRIFNGKVQSVHYGTDLRAKKGTPVKAPLSGKVALARWLFFTGYTVILDHGYGLFTIYAHLSKLKVKEGTVIAKEKIIGLSGATGRAEGPHLHWGVNLHGVRIDPLGFVKAMGLGG